MMPPKLNYPSSLYNNSFYLYKKDIIKQINEDIEAFLNEDEDYEKEDIEMPMLYEYNDLVSFKENDETKKLESKLHQALLYNDKKSFDKIISTMVEKYDKVIYESEYAYTVNEFTPFINMAKLLSNNLEKLRCFEAIENNISSYQKSELKKQYSSLEKDIDTIRNEERKKIKEAEARRKQIEIEKHNKKVQEQMELKLLREKEADIKKTNALTEQELNLIKLLQEVPVTLDKYEKMSAMYNYRMWAYHNDLDDELPLSYIPNNVRPICEEFLTNIVENFDEYDIKFKEWFSKVFGKIINCPTLE